MPFDPSTAAAEDSVFDPSTAVPEGRRTPKQMKVEKPSTMDLLRSAVPDVPVFREATDIPASLASGVIAPLAGGMAGLGQAAKNIVSPGMSAADRTRQVEQALTYEPQTGLGRAVSGAISYPFQKLSELGKYAGGKTVDITGSPLAGTAVETAISGAPIALGEIGKLGAERMKAPIRTPEQEALLGNLKTAQKMGLNLTPTEANLGAVKKALEGLTGSARMEKLNSLHNQAMTNAVIKDDLGIPEGVTPSKELFASMRKQAGQKYEQIRGAGNIKADAEFTKAINDIEAPYKRVSSDFPKTKPAPIIAELDALKEPAFSASSAIDKISELRDKADIAFRGGDKSLGRSLKGAANALEEQLGRHLEKTRAFQEPGTLQAYRTARKDIARLYSAEKAFNDTTKNFSAPVFANELKKGVPLTGGMLDVGRMGRAFPGSMREVDRMRDRGEFGYGDLFLGGLGHFMTGNLKGLAAVAARPLFRHGVIARPTATEAVPLSELTKSALAPSPLIPLSSLGQRNQ